MRLGNSWVELSRSIANGRRAWRRTQSGRPTACLRADGGMGARGAGRPALVSRSGAHQEAAGTASGAGAIRSHNLRSTWSSGVVGLEAGDLTASAREREAALESWRSGQPIGFRPQEPRQRRRDEVRGGGRLELIASVSSSVERGVDQTRLRQRGTSPDRLTSCHPRSLRYARGE
jgi:hypothetical protein